MNQTLDQIFGTVKPEPAPAVNSNVKASLDSIFGTSPEPAPVSNPKLDAIFKPESVVPVTSPNPVKEAVKNTWEDYSKAIPNFIDEAGRQDESTSKNPIIRVGENALGSTASGIDTVLAPITEAIKSFSNDFAENAKDPTNKSRALYDNPVISKLLDFFGGATGKLDEWAKSHPEAARNLQNAIVVGSAAVAGGEKGLDKPLGTVKGAVETSGKITDTVTNTAKEIKNKVTNKMAPKVPTFDETISEAQKIKNPTSKYTPIKSEQLYKSDSVKTTGKGPFRKEVAAPKPTGEDEVLSELVSQKKISKNNLPNENISAIKTEARAIDSGIDEFVNRPELNRPFNGRMLNKMTDKIMADAKASRVFISDSAEQKAYQDVIDIFKEEAAKNPYNNAGLRKTNKAFNSRMEDLLSDDIYGADEAGRSSSITQARIRAAKAVRSGSSDFLAEGIDKSQIGSTLKILHPDEATPFIDSAKNFENVNDFIKNSRSKMEDKILNDTYRSEKRRIARAMEKGASFDEALKKEGISIDVDADLKDIWNAAHTDVSATGGSVYKTQLQKEARLLNVADEIAYNARGTLNKTDLKKFFDAHPNVKKTLQIGLTGLGLKGGWDFLTGD